MLIRKVVIGASLVLMSASVFAGKASVVVTAAGTGSITVSQSILQALLGGVAFQNIPGLFAKASALPGAVITGNTVTTPVMTSPNGTKFILRIDENNNIVGVEVLS